jgi:aminopeptidase YwaD
MHKRFILLFFLPLLVVGQVEHAKETVKKLCSSDFHGRGYVNGGDSIAANYIATAFQLAGCQPLDKKGYFQAFNFNVNTFPNRMGLTVNGKQLIPGNEFVVAPNSGPAIAHALKLVEVTPEEVANQKLFKNKLFQLTQTGKSTSKQQFAFVFFQAKFSGDTLKMAHELMNSLRSSYPIVELVTSKFTWSVEQKQERFPLFQVQASAVDWSSENWTVEFVVDATIKTHTAQNVIACIPAKKKSKKHIVFTAHYDHLGRMGQQTLFPGGNDNASGVAMLLELATYYAKNPSDVNVVFIAFAGEEVGLLGSQFFVENPKIPLDKIRFLFNLDIMGSGEDGVTIVNATLFPKEFQQLQACNVNNQFLPKIASRGPAANSDHYFFTEKGVPSFFMYTMGPNKHYHDVDDSFEHLSFEKFNAIYQLLIAFTAEISKK